MQQEGPHLELPWLEADAGSAFQAVLSMAEEQPMEGDRQLQEVDWAAGLALLEIPVPNRECVQLSQPLRSAPAWELYILRKDNCSESCSSPCQSCQGTSFPSFPLPFTLKHSKVLLVLAVSCCPGLHPIPSVIGVPFQCRL